MMRIAVIKGFSIGDFILSTPLLRNLKKNFSESIITYISGADSSGIELIRKCPYIDETLSLNKQNLFEFIINILRFRLNEFDLLIDGAPITNETKKLSKLIRSKIKLHDKEFNINKSIIQSDLDVLEGFGLKTDSGYIEAFLGEKKPAKKCNVITLYLGRDSDEHRIWKNKNWFNLIKKIHFKYKLSFVIIGASDCKKVSNGLASMLGKRINIDNMSGKLSLEQTMSMLKKSKCFITINSGPMHLGAVSKTPMIALTGPSPDMWLSESKNIINIKSKNKPEIRETDPNIYYDDVEYSMSKIKVEMVFNAFEILMKQNI